MDAFAYQHDIKNVLQFKVGETQTILSVWTDDDKAACK